MNTLFSLVLLATAGTASQLPTGSHGFARLLNGVDNCDHDEMNNMGGPHRCYEDDSQCTGNRTCSGWGWCQGDSDCSVAPTPDQCTIDESKNYWGPHRCDEDKECRGDRYCSVHGWCFGEDHCDNVAPAPSPKPAPQPDNTPSADSCKVDERRSPLGPHQCANDDQCTGNRTCSVHGWCGGEHECPAPADQCSIDEKANIKGAHQCWSSDECKGDRWCSDWGWCRGDDNCPSNNNDNGGKDHDKKDHEKDIIPIP